MAAGITNIVFLSGYLSSSIETYFGDGNNLGVNITYSVESSPLGRGGAIRKALSSLGLSDEPVTIFNGDVYSEFNIVELINRYKSSKILNPKHAGTLLLRKYQSSYGIVEIDSKDRVTGFSEKPELPYWINAGVFALNPSILDELPQIGDHEIETFPRLAMEGRLDGIRTSRFCKSIDSFKDLSDVETHIIKGKTRN
jgi:NDP-sugar pyrophosphorylase family protein